MMGTAKLCGGGGKESKCRLPWAHLVAGEADPVLTLAPTLLARCQDVQPGWGHWCYRAQVGAPGQRCHSIECILEGMGHVGWGGGIRTQASGLPVSPAVTPLASPPSQRTQVSGFQTPLSPTSGKSGAASPAPSGGASSPSGLIPTPSNSGSVFIFLLVQPTGTESGLPNPSWDLSSREREPREERSSEGRASWGAWLLSSEASQSMEGTGREKGRM